jgi:hypothetical protein
MLGQAVRNAKRRGAMSACPARGGREVGIAPPRLGLRLAWKFPQRSNQAHRARARLSAVPRRISVFEWQALLERTAYG